MFNPSDHIECVDNDGAPNLVVGSAYCVEGIVSHEFVKRRFSDDVWGVKVYGDPSLYHHSHFRKATRWYAPHEFNLKPQFGEA